MVTNPNSRDRILEVAEGLVQTLGYDGFSYADVADRVGIRKASIHHHFPSKSDLGVELIEKFRRDCGSRLDSLAATDPAGRLEGYVGLFRETLRSGRMCLCGILAAGFANLSGELRTALIAALGDQETWLTRAVEDGQSGGSIRKDLSPEVLARNFLGGLEGALLLARVHDDPGRFESAVLGLIDGIRSGEGSGSRPSPD